MLILIGLGIIFFVVYAWQYYGLDTLFTSPDETANYFFIELFANQGQLSYEEPLNVDVNNVIKPRSMGVNGDNVVPGSFLGIILLYGLIAKIFGLKIVLYLTPLFSVISVIFFYLLIKEVFNKKVAFVSSVFLFFLPPFWYYSARGMFHNALFISLLIIGCYFIVKSIKNSNATVKAISNYFLAGLFVGLALITRTSETIWIFVVTILLFSFFRKNIKWYFPVIFFVVIMLVFSPILFLNNQLYGSPFSFSYSSQTIDSSSLQTFTQSSLEKFKQLIWPFNFDFNYASQSFYNYILLIFPWFSIFFVIGFIRLWKNVINSIFFKMRGLKYQASISEAQKKYGILFTVILIWLFLYYGSYFFIEYLDPTRIILGSSYLRYWLPIFVFGLPFVTIGISKVTFLFRQPLIKKIIISTCFLFFCSFSVITVLSDPLQGLYALKTNISQDIQKNRLIIAQTESNSIIISGYNDKVFFPSRKVIVGWPAEDTLFDKSMKVMIREHPVYFFYNPLDENSLRTKNLIHKFNYNIEEVTNNNRTEEVLYKIQ
ncbi:glycosyltransferase family 39 protein [Patescibacteria group bacterium]|nr:glycosyltransferase family 39 protein [Patescibacteria group bacterium]